MKGPEIHREPGISEPVEQQQTTLLDRLVDRTITLHARKKSYTNEYGRKDSYSIVDAAYDAIESSRLSSDELFSTLTRETTVKPEDVIDYLAGAVEEPTWDELKKHMNYAILTGETQRRHPELLIEDDRREDMISRSKPRPR